jgi:hypothetical protein
VAIGAVIGVAPLALYDLVAFGNVLEQGYGAKAFATPLAEGLYGVLASPSRGLLLYSPFLLFAVPAFVRAWRERTAVAVLVRWLGVATLALIVVYASYAEWWGGRVFGARFLTDALPAVFLALGLAVPTSRFARGAFAVAAGWALLLYSAGAVAYAQTPGGGGVWDTDRNVNFDPTPLFSWTDTQWGATLRAALAPDARELAAILLSLLILAALLWLERAPAPPRVRSVAA